MSQPSDEDVSASGSAAGVPVDMEWVLDPTVLSLKESAWRGDKLPSPFCTEVGRRMLLAELEFSEWVLRRVEKVQFERDRSVSRRISIDLSVRSDAPVFVDADGKGHWLVPLSVMRRRTLVNLDLRDEDGRSITMLGLRLAQKLDESMLRAAAVVAARGSSTALDLPFVDDFVMGLVAGEHADVQDQMKRVAAAKDDPMDPLYFLVRDPVFSAVLARLRRNFSLYAMLPVCLGRHRLLRMSFDEPTNWRYQKPSLLSRQDGSYRYRAGSLVMRKKDGTLVPRKSGVLGLLREPIERAEWLAAFGLQPTRVRFQIPSAENAASYHFEITAPQGVRIVQATLLAGRPNQPWRHISVDGLVGHSPTVGLHAVEIPNGSLCRAQVDLRVPARGWLTTVVASCYLVFVILASVLVNLIQDSASWSETQVTNIVLLLVTVSAGSATYVAQRDSGGVAARMVSRLRMLGTVAIALPAIGASLLVYAGTGSPGNTQNLGPLPFAGLAIVSLVIAGLISVVWWRSHKDERRVRRASPWDMTEDSTHTPFVDFLEALQVLQFDTAAVGVESAEGWHDRYTWSDATQKRATAALRDIVIPPSAGEPARPDSAAGCQCTRSCRAAQASVSQG